MVRQLLPEGLAEVAPGLELARRLAGIDLSLLSGYDCVDVLKAQYRQVNHERARLMATMAEVGLCGIGPDDELRRMAVPDEFSADEVRAALVLTRRAAEAQFWLAHDLLTRLPAVHAAMEAGMLDEPRARVFSEWTVELRPEAARGLCGQLLARAPRLTTGQLIEQIKKLAVAIDPDWARRRYEQAIADRKVVGYRNPDGSANLSGYNLPVDRVAASCGHIDALAKTAKHTGDPRPIDHIRADLFLGMTDGTYSGLDDAAILNHLRTSNEDRPEDDDGPQDGDGADDGAGPGGDDGRPDDGEESDSCAVSDGGEPDDDRDGDGAEESAGPVRVEGPAGPAAARGAGLELRVRLSTLLGHDQYPAELAGWGPVHAELARELAVTLGGAQWRFAITDEHGQLEHYGIIRARSTGAPTRMASCRAILELQIPAAALRDLAEDPTGLGAWAEVVTGLARRLDSITGEGRYAADSHRRTPGAALRRYLQGRDRSCVMIGCRAPAHTADQDHTRDHGRDGPTAEDNLGAVCRHDHRLKHEGSWRLHQPQAGHFHWTSRLGHTYHRPPPPILEPLPDPLCCDQPLIPLLVRGDTDWAESEIWEAPEPEPEPRPPPKPDLSDDIPPF